MDEQLEHAIVSLRGALRAMAWADRGQTEALVREARNVCNEWLARRHPLDLRTLSSPPQDAAE